MPHNIKWQCAQCLPLFYQQHRKRCIGATLIAILALAVIGLVVAQQMGKIDMVKFGKTKAGIATYSVSGAAILAIGLSALRLYSKKKQVPFSKSPQKPEEVQDKDLKAIREAPKTHRKMIEGDFSGSHFHMIFDNLYLANEDAVGENRMTRQARLDSLKSNGITAILCCLPEATDVVRGTTSPLSAEEIEARKTHNYFPNQGIKYGRIGLGDGDVKRDAAIKAKFLEQLPAAFKFIEEGRKSGKVVIHCNAGISRSPSVLIAYLVWKYQVTPLEAYDFVYNKRGAINVENFAEVLYNPTSYAHLIACE